MTPLSLLGRITSTQTQTNIPMHLTIQRLWWRLGLCGIDSMLHCTKPFIITLLSSRYDINNVEMDIKHQIIIITVPLWWSGAFVYCGHICIFIFLFPTVNFILHVVLLYLHKIYIYIHIYFFFFFFFVVALLHYNRVALWQTYLFTHNLNSVLCFTELEASCVNEVQL